MAIDYRASSSTRPGRTRAGDRSGLGCAHRRRHLPRCGTAEWVEDQLAEFGVSTFADLAIADRTLPAEQRYRLVVTVADVTLGQLVRLPWDYQRVYGLDPDEQSVADAVRASTAIPFFYPPRELTSAPERPGRRRWSTAGCCRTSRSSP